MNNPFKNKRPLIWVWNSNNVSSPVFVCAVICHMCTKQAGTCLLLSWDLWSVCLCPYVKDIDGEWVIDSEHVCHTWGNWGRPCRRSGRSLSVCHTVAWRLLPLRQHTPHINSYLRSLRNAHPSQSIRQSIGDQLAIPCNQYGPCCTAPEVPQWLWHLIKLLIAVLSFLRYPPWKVIESGWTIQLSAAVC